MAKARYKIGDTIRFARYIENGEPIAAIGVVKDLCYDSLKAEWWYRTYNDEVVKESEIQ